ncbi:MAG: leucyl aminopeptidase family protein [Crocinitomicaceae bacterium]|jgi:leucyl aminopeptidase
MIVEVKKYNSEDHLVFLLGKKNNEFSDIHPLAQELAKSFLEGKEEVDYLKLGNQFIFFVKEDLSNEKLRIAGNTVRTKLPKEATKVTITGKKDTALFLAEGLVLSNYQFLKYFKDAETKKNQLASVEVIGKFEKEQIQKLNNILKAVCWTRDMVNEPVSFLTATQLSSEIQNLGEEAKFSVQVLEKAKIEALKMGGLLAVNKGSIEPPTFTIIEYKPKNARNKKPLVLVGKGVVYDTGGLSLKPTAGSMDLMKSDMAGAACMAATIYAAALNNLDVHIVGLIPATDNRPGLNAYAPGDVVHMYDGTTIEVLNTDAEGRMILADALAYSAKYNPELVIDAATLTGAAVVAIGTKASCMMGNAKQKVLDKLIEAGNDVHERVVQLPFWDEYKDDLKSSVADMKNIGSRYAGMITAGKFLEHFVKAPYVHLDIAGPSFLESPENYKGKGGTGVGVRLLHEFIEKHF